MFLALPLLERGGVDVALVGASLPCARFQRLRPVVEKNFRTRNSNPLSVQPDIFTKFPDEARDRCSNKWLCTWGRTSDSA